MAAVFPCLSVAGIAHTSAGYLRFVRPLLAPSNNDWYPSDGSSGAALFVKAAILIHRAAYIAGRHAASTTVLTRCSAACRRRWRRIPITRRALVTACAAMLSTLTRHADLGQDTTNMSTSCRLHVQNGGVRSRETSDVVVRAGSLAQDTRVRGLKVVERQTTLLPCDWTKVVREAFKPLGNTLGTSESSRESGDVADSGPISRTSFHDTGRVLFERSDKRCDAMAPYSRASSKSAQRRALLRTLSPMPHAPAALHALRGEIHDFALNRIFAKLGALRAVSHRTTLQTRATSTSNSA
ncbi:hypothetical protein FB107DRAFT_252141 [Schizophyllum commune]